MDFRGREGRKDGVCPFGWAKKKWSRSIDGIAHGWKSSFTRCPWHFNNQFFNACAACTDRATVDKSHLNDRDLIKGAGKPFDVWRTRVTISNRPPTTDWIQIQRSKLNLHGAPSTRSTIHPLTDIFSIGSLRHLVAVFSRRFSTTSKETKKIRSVSRSRKTSPP